MDRSKLIKTKGFMLLEFLSLFALFMILVSLTVSSWQIHQMKKILNARANKNTSLWHLSEKASKAQEALFYGKPPDPASQCTTDTSTSKLGLFKCIDKDQQLEFSILMSRQ